MPRKGQLLRICGEGPESWEDQSSEKAEPETEYEALPGSVVPRSRLCVQNSGQLSTAPVGNVPGRGGKAPESMPLVILQGVAEHSDEASLALCRSMRAQKAKTPQ